MRDGSAFTDVGFASLNFFQEIEAVHDFLGIDLFGEAFQEAFQLGFRDEDIEGPRLQISKNEDIEGPRLEDIGATFDLIIEGYQFPEITTDDWDSNWLMVRGPSRSVELL